jgi:hypothetical protein
MRHYPPDQLLLDFAVFRMSCEKGFPFLLVLFTRFQQLIVDHQDAMPYRQSCSFAPSTFFEATIAFPQVGL